VREANEGIRMALAGGEARPPRGLFVSCGPGVPVSNCCAIIKLALPLPANASSTRWGSAA